MSVRNGDIVWVSLDKVRVAIVFHVDPAKNAIVCVAGTSKDRGAKPSSYVLVDPGSDEGKALKLTMPTYFHAELRFARVSQIERTEGRCPLDLFDEVDELLDSYCAKYWQAKKSPP